MSLFDDIPLAGQPGGATSVGLFDDIPSIGESAQEEDRSVAFGSFGRGFNRLQQAGTIVAREFGLISDDEAAEALARDQQDLEQYPVPESTRKAQEDLGAAKGWLESAGIIITNPGMMASVIGESLTLSVAPLIASAVGAFAGSSAGPVGTAAGLAGGAGVGSFAVEYASTVNEAIQEAGVDLKDREAVAAAFDDPEIMSAAREKAIKRGIPIAMFDALSAGTAGMIARRVGTGTAKQIAIGGGAEAGLQAGLGAAGEGAAQIVSEGEITSPGEVLIEGVAEIATGAPEVALGAGAQAAADRKKAGGQLFDDIPDGAVPAEQVIGTESDDRADSPRLTDADRASPIPNDLIDDGKAIIDEAIGVRREPAAVATPVSPEEPETLAAEPLQPGEGTKTSPIEITGLQDVHRGSEITDQPTPAQAEAGNYRKRRVKWNGLNITIETEQGGERTGVDADGKPWSVTMPAPYGEIQRTKGADGDAVDVYIGPSDTANVFVIDQIDPKDGVFDEHKVMLGFPTEEDARQTYAQAFSDGTGEQRAGAVTPMSIGEFQQWLANGNEKKPVAYENPKILKDKRGPTRKSLLDIIEFVASIGGVQDFKGELKSLDLQKKFVPGFGRLVRKNGLPLDKAREAAEEAGYLTSGSDTTSTVADFLNALEESTRGNRVFSLADQADVQSQEIEKANQQHEADRKRVAEEINEFIQESGAQLAGNELDQMIDLVLLERVPVDEAIVEVFERSESALDDTSTDERQIDDIPFENDARAEGGQSHGSSSEGQERSEPDGRTAERIPQSGQQSDRVEPDSAESRKNEGDSSRLADPRPIGANLDGRAIYQEEDGTRFIVTDEGVKLREAAGKRSVVYQVASNTVVPPSVRKPKPVLPKPAVSQNSERSSVAIKAAVRLEMAAATVEKRANEKLNQDRNTNTARRAAMAASAEADAAADLAIARTMRNIAQAHRGGEVKALVNVATKADVVAIRRELSRARHAHAQRINQNYEKLRDRGFKLEDIKYARAPEVYGHISHVRDIARAGMSVPGSKRQAARLQKLVSRFHDTSQGLRTSDPKIIDDLNVVAKATVNGAEKWAAKQILEDVRDFNRLAKLGITDLISLRTALTEFIEFVGTAKKTDPLKEAERALVGFKSPGFFQTPVSLAERMVEEAGIQPGMDVLEPSAGAGRIADAVRSAGVEPDTIERMHRLQDLLKMKGHEIVADDFMEFEGRAYDRIVMNPPFEQGQDIEHVRRAYDLLKPGGRIVAIMSTGPFFRTDRKATEFRSWLDQIGGVSEELPDGSFKESGTGVATRIVTIDKGAGSFSRKVGDVSRPDLSGKPAVEVVSIPHMFDGDDFRAERTRAKKWARDHIRGHYTNGDTGWDIEVGSRGIKESVSGVRTSIDLDALQAIPRLLETAVLYETLPAKNPNIVAAHHFLGAMSVDGRLRRVQLTVLEDRDGKRYYDQHSSDIKGPADASEGHPQLRTRTDRDGAEPALNIGDLFRGVNYSDGTAVIPAGETIEAATSIDGSSRFEITKERFSERAAKVHADLRASLTDLGLEDVGLRIVESIRLFHDGQMSSASGRYMSGLIDVALDSPDPHAVMQHEAVHALRHSGVFTNKEWAALERRSIRVWMPRYEIRDRYAGYPESTLIEEGIAHAYSDWASGARNEGGVFRTAFRKIRAVIEAIANALRGNGFTTVDEIFGDMASGKIGRRPRSTKDAPAAYSIPSRDGDLFATEVVETIDGPADQYIVPGTERISDKELAERQFAGKKKPTKARKDAGGLPLFGDEKDQGSLFALRRALSTVEDGQRVQQGFLARGQFIDRAIRAPFAVFGGIDDQGRWNWGNEFSDKAEKIIKDAKFSDEGVFSWLNPSLLAVRAGVIDRHGLSDEYITADRKRGLDSRRIMAEGADFLIALKAAHVGVEEASVLQAILTGEKVDDADMQKLAEPIREAIDQLGQEAVSLGLLDAESFERNRGTYLHRVYQKHEADQSKLSGFFNKVMEQKRKKIVGDQFKGRGIFLDIDEKRLLKDDPRFPAAQRGKVQNGEKFRVLDLISTQHNAVDPDRPGAVVSRVYLPADRSVPDKYSGYTDKGVWEVRGKKGGKLTIWRDFTKSERENMGEIFDARYTIGKTYMMMASDLANGRFYKQIAENEQWAQKSEPSEAWKDAAEARRLWADTETQWIKVPDSTIPKTGGKKRWGALAGMYVRAEIWRDLNEVDKMFRPGSWRQLLTQWKLNKTARHPVVHMNNVMSNLMFMDMADIRSQDLVRGIRSYVTGDRHYQDALEHGAFGSDMMSQEIRDNVLKPILEEISADMQDGISNSFFARAKLVGKIADRLWSIAKTLDQKMIDVYRAEDEIFRMATYIRRREMGDDQFSAADFARHQFLDYDIRAPWVNTARNTALPFIAYTYRAVPLIAQAMAHRPWKLVKYFTLAYVANALAYAWDGEGDEEKERYSLRDEEQGYTWVGVPRMIRMPWRDQHGLPQFIDIRRWIPAGDVFDMNQGQSAVPIPAPIQFGGPMMLAAELFLNKQAFTGDPIVNDLTDNWWDKTKNVTDWAWKSWMPSAFWVPNSWYWDKIGNAVSGATDSKGRPYSLPNAILSSAGIKVKPQDVDQNLFWKGFEMKQIGRELRSQARRLHRLRERKIISESAFEAGMKAIELKFERLSERADELGRISAQ